MLLLVAASGIGSNSTTVALGVVEVIVMVVGGSKLVSLHVTKSHFIVTIMKGAWQSHSGYSYQTSQNVSRLHQPVFAGENS
jgi:hypothetical protein